MTENRGLPIVLSGPSGCGKGRIVRTLLAKYGDRFALSVSATTRSPRPGEVDGRDYSFITREQFEEKLAANEILEHTQYAGNYYGTPREEVERRCSAGMNVILEIETEGAMNVRRLCSDAILVFVLPPSPEVLENRLRGRGTETEEVILTRLAKAKKEVPLATFYDYIIVNGDDAAEVAADQIAAIATAEGLRACRRATLAEKFFQ